MAHYPYVLLGNAKRAANLLPFAFRMAKNMEFLGKRHVRREFADESWVEITQVGGKPRIRINGGPGYGAGTYILVTQDYRRLGLDTVFGAQDPLYVNKWANYFVYLVNGYLRKAWLLFWFYGGNYTSAIAENDEAHDSFPRITGYFFNNQNEDQSGGHALGSPLLHLGVRNLEWGQTDGILFWEYLLVGETRAKSGGTYGPASVEGWQCIQSGGWDTNPATTYGPNTRHHTFAPPIQKLGFNDEKGDESKLWAWNAFTDTDNATQDQNRLGYLQASTNYLGFTNQTWTTWIDLNNATHFTYPKWGWTYSPDDAGWDVWNMWSLFSDPPIININYKENEIHFILDKRDSSNAGGEINGSGIFAASMSTQTTTLLKEFSTTTNDYRGEILLMQSCSDSATAVGYALPRKASYGTYQHKVDFYYGSSYASASLVFSFDFILHGGGASYDPNTVDTSTLDEQNPQKWYGALAYTLVDDTPGAEVFAFQTTVTNTELGWPSVVGTYTVETGELALLWKSVGIERTQAKDWIYNHADGLTKGLAGSPSCSTLISETSATTYANGGYARPPKIIRYDKADVIDFAFYNPSTESWGITSWITSYSNPVSVNIASSSFSIPLFPGA